MTRSVVGIAELSQPWPVSKMSGNQSMGHENLKPPIYCTACIPAQLDFPNSLICTSPAHLKYPPPPRSTAFLFPFPATFPFVHNDTSLASHSLYSCQYPPRLRHKHLDSTNTKPIPLPRIVFSLLHKPQHT